MRVRAAVDYAHIQDGKNRCGGEQTELSSGERIVATDHGKTDGDSSGEADRLDDVLSEECDGKGRRRSR